MVDVNEEEMAADSDYFRSMQADANRNLILKPAIFPVEDDSPTLSAPDKDVILPEDYRPTKCDVISGRGRKSYNHIANRRFRQLTAMNLKRYQNARCKVDKTLVVIGIVNSIRMCSPCGGFVKKCSKRDRWVSMSDEEAREKVGHCLRDMIASTRETAPRVGSKPKENLAQLDQPAQQLVSEIYSPELNEALDEELPPTVTNKEQEQQQKQNPENSANVNKIDRVCIQSVRTNDHKNPNEKTTSTQQGAEAQGIIQLKDLNARSVKKTNNEQDSYFMDDNAAEESNDEDLLRANQEMSEQQKKILYKLENGFKGSVAELLRATS